MLMMMMMMMMIIIIIIVIIIMIIIITNPTIDRATALPAHYVAAHLYGCEYMR